MQLSDVREVAAIEQSIYAAPWTEGNFVDSLMAGYCAWTLRATSGALIGYFVLRASAVADPRRPLTALPSLRSTVTSVPWPVGTSCLKAAFSALLMAAIDEAHLLNLSIASTAQGLGHGLFLLRKAAAVAVEHNASSVILEVRPSNLRALAIYRRFGFREHGLRRRYYPASHEDQQSREDAIVMRFTL